MLSQFQRASKKVSERIEERELASIRLAKQVGTAQLNNIDGILHSTTAASATALLCAAACIGANAAGHLT